MVNIRKASQTGRPIGGDDFLRKLENQTGRLLVKLKPGPK